MLTSGFPTRTIGLDQALWNSSTTPRSSIFLTSPLMASRRASGIRYGRSLTVFPGSVLMSWAMMTVVLPGVSEKTSLLLASSSQRTPVWSPIFSREGAVHAMASVSLCDKFACQPVDPGIHWSHSFHYLIRPLPFGKNLQAFVGTKTMTLCPGPNSLT